MLGTELLYWFKFSVTKYWTLSGIESFLVNQDLGSESAEKLCYVQVPGFTTWWAEPFKKFMIAAAVPGCGQSRALHRDGLSWCIGFLDRACVTAEQRCGLHRAQRVGSCELGLNEGLQILLSVFPSSNVADAPEWKELVEGSLELILVRDLVLCSWTSDLEDPSLPSASGQGFGSIFTAASLLQGICKYLNC